MRDWSGAGFATRAIHAGQDPDPQTGSVTVPVYQTSTFAQEAVGRHQGWDYARSGNPTRDALESAIAILEGGSHGLAFASGLAATQNVLYLLEPGDRMLMSDAVHAALTDRPIRMVWIETPTNPLLKVVDISAVARLAAGAGALTLVDNTFATPYLTRPLDLGADLVLHSATKYLGGHSDVVGGLLVTRSAELAERLRFTQNAAGAVPGPFDCFLVMRGLGTLAVRMDRSCENAAIVADWLAGRPEVSVVHYPGAARHPQAAVVERQMRLPGAMVSFELAAGEPRARSFV